MREEFADLLAGFAIGLEAVLRAEALQLLALQLRDLLTLREAFGHRLRIHGQQLRLVIESLQVRRPACLVQEDDALGLGREVERVHGSERRDGGAGCEEPRGQQRMERHQPETGCAAT